MKKFSRTLKELNRKGYFSPENGVHNLNEIEHESLSKGQKIADWLVELLGSWKFIIVQTVILFGWAILNLLAWIEHWDPYPFILLNLFLSLQAAYAAPIIMMSQNRQAARDRLEAHNDYLINKKAEQEIRQILEKLNTMQHEIHQKFNKLSF